jgi:hypothetical protein
MTEMGRATPAAAGHGPGNAGQQHSTTALSESNRKRSQAQALRRDRIERAAAAQAINAIRVIGDYKPPSRKGVP